MIACQLAFQQERLRNASRIPSPRTFARPDLREPADVEQIADRAVGTRTDIAAVGGDLYDDRGKSAILIAWSIATLKIRARFAKLSRERRRSLRHSQPHILYVHTRGTRQRSQNLRLSNLMPLSFIKGDERGRLVDNDAPDLGTTCGSTSANLGTRGHGSPARCRAGCGYPTAKVGVRAYLPTHTSGRASRLRGQRY